VSLTQLNSAVELLNKSDSSSMAVNRDNSVLKYNFIMKQYEPVAKGRRRLILPYLYRIKLICRWRKLEKKRQERLKERKMNILQLIDGEEKYIRGLHEYIDNVKQPI
jgi:pantothenate kinase-related protein Tda10